MLFDLLPMFEHDEPVKQVCCEYCHIRGSYFVCGLFVCGCTMFSNFMMLASLAMFQLLETWALLVSLTLPSADGFGLDTLNSTEIVGRSFMAQFEALASARSPTHLKGGCVISYAKILLLGHGKCGYFECTFTHT